MVMIHIGPVEIPGIAGTAYTLPYGRASILFAALAGMGVSLLSADRSSQRIRDARLRLVIRAAMLFPLGLVLHALDTGVAVILQYYAIYFLVAAVAARLPDRRLLGLASALVIIGPATLFGAARANAAWFEIGGSATISEPFVLARDLLLTGYYPVLTWTPPLLFGMWLGRRDLRSTRLRWRMVFTGVIVAATAYSSSWLLGQLLGAPFDIDEAGILATAEPHSEMPLAIIGATAVAVAVIGGSMLVTARLPRTTWPLVAMGQLALTIYVGHLIVLVLTPDLMFREDVPGAALVVAWFTLFTLVAATLWRIVFARGPLEAAFNAPWALTRQFRQRPEAKRGARLPDRRPAQGDARPRAPLALTAASAGAAGDREAPEVHDAPSESPG